MSRVLVVGLDGATFDIIRPLAKQGRLPTLAQLMEEGASGPLSSTSPPITPTAWTTFFTGKNPGRHGIYDFRVLDPATYEWYASRLDSHREKSLWQILGEAGLRSIVIDVPFTHPPQPFNGWMITGYGTPRTPGTIFTFPANLADHLPEALRKEVRLALPEHRFDRSRAFVEEWKEIMAGRKELLRYLVDQPWDFFMTVFSVTDNLAHVFWTYLEPSHPNYGHGDAAEFREALFWAYEESDRLLGDLISWAGSDVTTLVMSDHGFGSVHPRQVVFQRLVEGGYVHYGESSGESRLRVQLMRRAMDAYTRFPRLREWVKSLRPGQAAALRETLRRGKVLPEQGAIDVSRSRVIPADFGLQIWVNERGRFARGPVGPADREALLDELSEHLLATRNPSTGLPVFEGTERASTLFEGEYLGRAPDLVLRHRNFYDPDATPAPTNPHLEGGHTETGILLARGAAIRPAQEISGRLPDLAPTILHLLGQPVPPDMDGQVLEDMFTSEAMASHPVVRGNVPARYDEARGTGAGYTAEEEAAVEEQLRQLGYIS